MAATTPTLASDLRRLDQRVGAEEVLGARERVDALEVGLERLAGGPEADHARRWRATPASMQASAIGATASSVALPAAVISSADALLGDDARVGDLHDRAAHHVAHALRRAPGPAEPRATMPAISTTAPWRSVRARDLALLAGFLALLGCCLLGLLAGHQATLIAWRAAPTSCWSSSPIQPATKGRVAADEQQADDDLGREADREDVELRHDARDDAERGVGEDQGQQHRPGDLDGRDEDRAEDGVDAGDEAAERRRLVEADEVVGAREALDDPAVAADGDEDEHADERVGLREDRGLGAGQRVDEAAVGEADRACR